MKKPISLISVWLVLWSGAAAFAYYLYNEGNMYPVELVGSERMRDTMYAIYVIVGVTIVFSVIWIFAWRALWRNQGHYNSIAEKHSSTVSAFPCPLSLTGDILSINRGFSVQTVDLRMVRWIHVGIALINGGWTGASLILKIHYIDGRKSSFLIDRRKYSSSVDEILDTIVADRPNIMVSRGQRDEIEYKECKRRYKSNTIGR